MLQQRSVNCSCSGKKKEKREREKKVKRLLSDPIEDQPPSETLSAIRAEMKQLQFEVEKRTMKFPHPPGKT